MKFSRFKNIILNNRKYEVCIKQTIEAFHNRVQWSGDIPKIMKEIGSKLNVFIFQIPMYDEDIGALYLNTGHTKYLLLNSSQPRNKMYFAFCHDIYHILNGTSDFINNRREVHLNQDYADGENELKASLFAANLLMPEFEFKKMYELYKAEYKEFLLIVAKLMNYFNTTFMSVLIRLYELDIYSDIKDVLDFLDYTNESIEEIFDKLWMDKELLLPINKDDVPYIFDILNKEGTELLAKEMITEYNYSTIIENTKQIYEEMKLRK